MCGISGILQTPLPADGSLIRKMTDSLSHRGPDGVTHWQNPDQTIQFGHCRLSIIDLSSNGNQPMHYLDRYTIIHNGEIYNYVELRKELISHGYSFRSNSDTEVILAAFDLWEENCVDHFDGMFAFAIWDEKEKELFAARDRFGEKPFYYFINDNRFVFASEMKAIWAAGIPRIPNLRMVFNFITIGYVNNPARAEETFYDNICRLPPASFLFYVPASQELTIEKYWEISPTFLNEPADDKKTIENWHALFQTSVKNRLRSDVALGSSLSGGLDSSSIVATMKDVDEGHQNRQSFTAIFPGFDKDESAYAKMMAERTGMTQHTIAVTPEDLVNEWDNFIYHQEEPVSSSSAFAQYKVFQLARREGVKVLLDGQGADETLAGYHRYYKWYWQELFIKRKLLKSKELEYAGQLGVSEKFGYKNIIASLFPDLASVILEQQYLAHALGQEDLSRDFVRLQSKEAYYTTPPVRTLNEILHFNTFVHGLEELLRYADRNSMAHGREVRLPFLHHDLVTLNFSLPSRFKIREGWTKWILRKSMEGIVPRDICWRKDKTGFEPPQKQWMQHKQVAEMVHEARKKLVAHNILKRSVLDKPIGSQTAYEKNTYDWRYLAVAPYL